MTYMVPMKYTFSCFDIKYGTYFMFTWDYILNYKSISYSVVNADL
jgi:hypothetical protein